MELKQNVEKFSKEVEASAAIAKQSHQNTEALCLKMESEMRDLNEKLSRKPNTPREQIDRVINYMKQEFLRLSQSTPKPNDKLVYRNSNSDDKDPETVFLCDNIYQFILQIEEDDSTKEEKDQSHHLEQYLRSPLDLEDTFYLKYMSIEQRKELLEGNFNELNVAALSKLLLKEYEASLHLMKLYKPPVQS